MLTKELSKLPATRLSFIEPMYAQAVSELPSGDLWTYEAKLDGYRCLAAKDCNELCSGRAGAMDSRLGFMISPELAKTPARHANRWRSGGDR